MYDDERDNENQNEGQSFTSYDDYLKSMEQAAEKISEKETTTSTTNTVEADQGTSADGTDLGGETPKSISDDRTSTFADGGMKDDNVTPVANGGDGQLHGLLNEGGDFGASGFSDVAGSATETAGGVLNAAKSGIGNAFRGVTGAVMSGLKGLFNKGKDGAGKVASTFNIPIQAAVIGMSVLGGGTALSIGALLFGTNNKDVAKYVDEANCNDMSMINNYFASNGAWEDWTEKSAQGAGKSIYTGLASAEPWSFESYAWNGSEWVETTIDREGFGFSDEAIAGMLSNAWAESKIRADAYEMDYLVPDIDREDDAGNKVHHIGDADVDFELARTHHSNWDAYVRRMFDIYAADGMSIDTAAYEWTSDYTGPGSLQNPEAANEFGINVTKYKAGLTGLYPGIGLWQWTGQRAWNLAQFANIQANPSEGNQDLNNDVMEGIDCQLGFLYFENWGDFSEYMPEYDGVSPYSRSYKVTQPSGAVVRTSVTFEGGGYNVLGWGRQNTYKYTGVLGTDDGSAYKNLSFPSNDSYLGANEERAVNMEQDLFAGQQTAELDEEKDVWVSTKDGGEDETTIRWPKYIIKKNDNSATIGVGEDLEHEYVPDGYLSNSWTEWGHTLPQYITVVDNRVAHDYELMSEADYNSLNCDAEAANYHIELADLSKIDPDTGEHEKDKGYWSETSNSDLTNEITEYKNKFQSLEKVDAAETREGSEVRVGRTFNDHELPMFEELYEVKVTKRIEKEWPDDMPESERTDDNCTKHYWKTVSLALKEPGATALGADSEISQLRDKMADPEGKYIAADLTICAGAESAVECARQFYLKWEGGPETDVEMMVDHLAKAGSFYILMQTDGWKSSETYAHSILEMVDGNRTSAALRDIFASYVNKGCDTAGHVPDGIAAMAVSWAWPQGESGLPWYDIDERVMDGGGDCYKLTACTSLYCAVKDAVLDTADPYYSSCDRGVMTAVRAAGADDEFPPGNSGGQLRYAQEHPDKWEALGPVRSMSALETLEPGDLLLASGHVMVFVGPDLPLEKWPGGAGMLSTCTYSVVHSSRSSSPVPSSRGPRCDNDCKWILSDSKMWYAFRATKIDDSSAKKAAAEPVFLNGFTDGSGTVGATYTPRD